MQLRNTCGSHSRVTLIVLSHQDNGRILNQKLTFPLYTRSSSRIVVRTNLLQFISAMGNCRSDVQQALRKNSRVLVAHMDDISPADIDLLSNAKLDRANNPLFNELLSDFNLANVNGNPPNCPAVSFAPVEGAPKYEGFLKKPLLLKVSHRLSVTFIYLPSLRYSN